jgi:hypothetical protein
VNYPYLIPGSQGNTAAFVAGSVSKLGSYNKPLDAVVAMSVDYSQVVPAWSISSYSFKVKPGGFPELGIYASSGSAANSTLLEFSIFGGIAGRAYEITIITKMADDETRSDVLTVNVQGDDFICVPFTPAYPQGYSGAVSSDGSVIVNKAPRFFVSGTPPVGANVLDRWYDTATGEMFDFISNGVSTYWQIAAGSGGGSISSASILNITPIRPDGVATTFPLTAVGGRPVTLIGANTLFVSLDGVWQDSATQYTVVGNQITFAQAPSADSVVFMLWFAPPTSP